MTIHFISRLRMAHCMCALLALSACSDKAANSPASPADVTAAPAATSSAPAAQNGKTVATPPTSVNTVLAKKRDFAVTLQATGAVVAVSNVDVRPQVSGVITKVHVQEGQFVKKGEALVTLDSRADEANVAKMRATVTKDQATLADARRQFQRSRELLEKNFISQVAVDTSQTLVESQVATLATDQAALNAALVALSYNKITAASSGRIGSINVFAGSSVQANLTTLMNITQLDPIDIAFSLPQRYISQTLEALKEGNATVAAKLPDSKADLVGKLLFVDSNVDAATGTVKAKARYENKGFKLWPGAFVNIAVTAKTIKDAVVIPTAAVVQTARGSVVYVAVDGKAALKPVKILASEGEDSAVSGVNVGDAVVMEGRQNLRPDSPLVERKPDAKPQAGKAAGPATPASDSTAAATAPVPAPTAAKP